MLIRWPLGIEPREWQGNAFPIAIRWLQGAGDLALIQAVMGAGKSILMRAIAKAWLDAIGARVVIGAPTKSVADQLAEGFGVVPVHSSAMSASDAPLTGVVVGVYDSLRGLARAPGTLLMADEAHRADTETFRELRELLQPEKTLGFSATPRKGSKALGLWLDVLYTYRVIDALRDGVIVPWSIMPWTGEACPVDDAARSFAALDGAPGLINARDIADAEAFAATVDRCGVVHSRMSRAQIKAELARLESGDLRWMCHVSILAEGFDMPILGRYIFRSKVVSPVSFAQQAGRILRVSPGKERAIFYDPLDLFDTLGIGVGAALSGGEEPDLSVDYAQMLRDMGLEPPEVVQRKRKPKKKKAKALAYLQVYYRQLAVACREAANVDEYKPGPWRNKAPSEGQLQYALALAPQLNKVRRLPEPHRQALRAVYHARDYWRAGDTSDWIDIMRSLRRTHWTREHNRLVPSPARIMEDMQLLGVTG